MAGFLGMNNYSKPGKGVDAGQSQSRFRVFFDVFVRKFWRLVRLNLLYVLLHIPLFGVFFLLLPYMPSQGEQLLSFYLFCAGALLYLSIVGFGFVGTGFSYVLGNFTRETHAWVEQDMLSKIKENWKQGALLSVIDLGALLVFVFNYHYYANVMPPSNLSLLLRTALAALFILYMMMHFYLYQMIVTFRLKLSEMMRNALILTLAHLPRNLLVAFLAALIALLTFSMDFWSGLALTCFISPALIGYLVHFITGPIITRYMMPSQEEE